MMKRSLFIILFLVTGVSKAQEFTTYMEDGGWCWYQDPRAVIKNEKLIIGGLSGESGDVKVSVYDLEANNNLGTVVLNKNFQADDHDVPAFHVRPDGSLLAVYAKHGKERIHYYRISSSKDYLRWGEEKQFVHDYESKVKGGVTYMNLYSMKNEGLLYNFFRDGPNYNPAFITSSDHGETWGNETHFISDGLGSRNRPYVRYLQRDDNTIGVSFTEAHPRKYGNSLYYADFRNGTFYNVDGTKIKDLSEGPLTPSESEKIYQGSAIRRKGGHGASAENSAWTCAIEKDKKSRPHIGYTRYVSNGDHRYRLASWNGKKWVDREIAFAGKCLYTNESSYTGLLALDPEDPRNVFISTDVDPNTGKDLGGTHEIYSAKVKEKDDITSIKWKAITSNSKFKNIRPIVVYGEGYKVLLWLGDGHWNTFVDYKVNVKGLVLKRS
ncbi:BNR-4 repeat-containing protein [Flavivirga rizhaonensis]|uniref:Exo-alpha-sialidase n=1 Tax=Flavivirga rizhaonensis TaxID=2559571 RepID=A0A4S1E2H6_9FLAO|nr:BNR-4 repeat-containing protein [Flavivirga rizhaonensis]TGV04605.1 hypothetical protein EM932_00310 [Flavivirga rizhaonensis]